MSSLGASGSSLQPKEASSSAGDAGWGPGTWTPAQAFSALDLTLREAAGPPPPPPPTAPRTQVWAAGRPKPGLPRDAALEGG